MKEKKNRHCTVAIVVHSHFNWSFYQDCAPSCYSINCLYYSIIYESDGIYTYTSLYRLMLSSSWVSYYLIFIDITSLRAGLGSSLNKLTMWISILFCSGKRNWRREGGKLLLCPSCMCGVYCMYSKYLFAQSLCGVQTRGIQTSE